MKEFSKYLIWFLIAAAIVVAFYFFVWKPTLESEFKRGLTQCEKDTDTLYLPGKDSIVYRDTSFSANKPVLVKDDDSLLTLTTSFDTTFVSGKDTISNRAEVKIAVKKENGIWDILKPVADWIENYTHKDFVQQPDTIKIYFPKYVEIPVKETNWLIAGLAYVGGVITAIIIFFLAN